jgi:hypothetical protein
VEYDVALAASTHPSDFELQMRTFRRLSRTVKASDVANAGAGASGQTPKPPASAPAKPKAPEPAEGTIDGLTTGGGFDFLGGTGPTGQ